MYFRRSTSLGWIFWVNTCSLWSVNHAALIICLQDGKEEHVLNVGGGHYASTLAHRSGWSDPDLLLYLGTDDGFCLVRIKGVTRVGHIGMQTVTEKLLDNGDRTVVGLSDIPEVVSPSAWQCPCIP